ncbi:hypothetical protein MKW98_028131 [Papaver atlanticum]|uniref:VDE lipocalin domain-containing protein n=1 Tax=Papaver atlanticum TaxID=357466 RepID=A0AAD4SX81_9MAGN|nr:hypothetical protein MKW98_028131 [Papaver atlanticum]
MSAGGIVLPAFKIFRLHPHGVELDSKPIFNLMQPMLHVCRHIKCGDLFENRVVDEFNECAVSRKKCVPQKSDVGLFPVPDPSALVKNLTLKISLGNGNLSWRIRTPDGGFFTRTATQKFVQDPVQPGILYNHDNEFVHYQDDWYILSSKIENNSDDYVFVYYRGRNDAWDGYGGAFLYTRSSVLPDSIVPEIEKAAKSVGRDFNTLLKQITPVGLNLL